MATQQASEEDFARALGLSADPPTLTKEKQLSEEFVHSLGLSADPKTLTKEEQPLYKGSCHCGFLSYVVRLDFTTPHPLSQAVLTRCNCTVCVKYGILTSTPAPASSFELTSPLGGRAELKDYRTSEKSHRWLCPTCGVQVFQEGVYSFQGMEVSYMRVNASTLDGRVDGGEMVELKDVRVRYYGGRNPADIGKGAMDEPWPHGLR
jgi:hypothetical protein